METLKETITDKIDKQEFSKEGANYHNSKMQKSKKAMRSMQEKLMMKQYIEESYKQHMEAVNGSKDDRR